MPRLSRRRDSSSESTSSDSSDSRSSSDKNSYGRYERRNNKSKNKTRKRSSTSSYTPPRLLVQNNSVYEQSTSRKHSIDLEEANKMINNLEQLVNDLLNKNAVQNPRVTIKSDCIPEFSPDIPGLTSKVWVDKIDQLAQINGWNEQTIIYHMQSRLSGLAKSWYNSLSNYNNSWEQWKQIMLINAFPEHRDFPSTLKKMLARKKLYDESWTEYYFAKMKLLRRCEIIGKNAVSMIIDGIYDLVIENGAKAGRYEQPEILYKEYLSTLGPVERPQVPVREKYNKTFVGTKRHSSSYKFSKSSYGTSKEGNYRPKCFNCGNLGHVSTACQKPLLECKKCKRLGHTEKYCYKNVNGFLCTGLIDTGCATVTLRYTDAKRFGVKWQESNVQRHGYAGGRSKALDSATSISKLIWFRRMYQQFLIVADEIQDVSLMIGQPFINQANVVLVVKGDQIRIFSSDILDLPEVDHLPPTKIKNGDERYCYTA
ncbi:hypothetical protein NQ317_000070 [Molorchus minor]|uniref:CCHC-type domain-containing protein n=1 Tax=Molorchus minor TaxID=1323400 RepID=A0ABQ9JJM0_9CUCU|nr:hypothetical protein NQ317_000070 [Molorchus minor]